MKRIGVFALQGGFQEHIRALHQLGVEAIPVRLPHKLKKLDGIIIPGGESTSIGKLLKDYNLTPELQKLIAQGLPVLGSCAGMVLLAREVIGLNAYSLGAMDIAVRRNAFGRQVDSFEADLSVPVLGESPFHAIFIRAPLVEKFGPNVEVLAKLPAGTPVAVREENIIACAFHPELTDDTRLHSYFLSLADRRK